MAEAKDKGGVQRIGKVFPPAWPRQPDGTFSGLRVASTEAESDTMQGIRARDLDAPTERSGAKA
jgi:hypothetical protein